MDESARNPTSSDDSYEPPLGVRRENLEQFFEIHQRLRRMKLATFGPTERDRAIYRAVELYGEELEHIAQRHQLSVRTVKNIARTMRKRFAQQQYGWDRMSFAQLCDEEARLRGLERTLREALVASTSPLTTVRTVESRGRVRKITTTKTRHGDLRFLDQHGRVQGELLAIEHALDARTPAEEAAEARRAYNHARTVPRRTRRRKSLTGRVLRLPKTVRARPARCSETGLAWLLRTLGLFESGVVRIGIPPPKGLAAHDFESCAIPVRAGPLELRDFRPVARPSRPWPLLVTHHGLEGRVTDCAASL